MDIRHVYVVGVRRPITFGSALRAVAYAAGPGRDRSLDAERVTALRGGWSLCLIRMGECANSGKLIQVKRVKLL